MLHPHLVAAAREVIGVDIEANAVALLRSDLGWTGWARHKVLVASRQPLTLESLVLYLLSSACDCLRESSSRMRASLNYSRILLSTQLGG